MSKYFGFSNKIFMKRMVKALNSSAMRNFETDNPVSAEQKRWLTFGAVLSTQNMESCRTFKIIADKSAVTEMISLAWSIQNREDALSTVKELSTANGHTPFADDVYKTLVQNGRLDPIHLENLNDILGLENAFKSTVKRLIDSSEFPDEMTDEDQEMFQEIVLSGLEERIDAGIESYKIATDLLIDLGYTERELSGIKSTAAWDLGRTGIVARWSVKTGYIEEYEALSFFKTAADNAVEIYNNWREYLAGYVLGRALGYCSDSTDIYVVLRYLLNYENSPFREVLFNN